MNWFYFIIAVGLADNTWQEVSVRVYLETDLPGLDEGDLREYVEMEYPDYFQGKEVTFLTLLYWSMDVN